MSSKTKRTAAQEETRPALVPKLRFPEFLDGPKWPQHELGSIAVILKGKGITKADLDPNGSQACIRYGELYTQYGETIREAVSRTKIPASELFLSKPDDVIIPSSGETKIDIAKASCVLAGDIALGGDLNVIRSKLSGTFLSYYLNGPKRLDIAKVAQGDTVVHLYPHQLEALHIAVPSPAEQQKIAECLSSVDELMAAQVRKVEALKTHKKGLMQQLFPREGETQPRLRFPEFQNAGEWVKRRLGDFADVSASGDLDTATFSPEYSEKHCFPVYSNAVEGEGIYGFSSVARHQAHSVTITARGTLGRAFLRNTGFVGIGRLIVVSNFTKDADPSFLKECWDHLAVIPQEVTSIPQLTAVAARATALPFPKLPEQQRIASCLSSLDALITAETQKLEALKTHKKGLMQQLFPSLEAVEA